MVADSSAGPPHVTHDHTAGPVVQRHHWLVRVTHWVAAIAIAVMVGSGLRIFNAYPAFARKGDTFCCWPLEGTPAPGWLTFGGWLAGARNWHFAMMWVLVVNALVYLGFVYLHGEWRDLVPRRGDPRDAWEMMKFYVFARREHPRQGKHNALQKLAYFAMPVVAAVTVLSGIAIWKPVSLGWLTALFGGYVWARYWHFVSMLVIVAMILAHVFMVLATDPYSLRSMITGKYDERFSPEARNARPFYHLLPHWGRMRGVGMAGHAGVAGVPGVAGVAGVPGVPGAPGAAGGPAEPDAGGPPRTSV